VLSHGVVAESAAVAAGLRHGERYERGAAPIARRRWLHAYAPQGMRRCYGRNVFSPVLKSPRRTHRSFSTSALVNEITRVAAMAAARPPRRDAEESFPTTPVSGAQDRQGEIARRRGRKPASVADLRKGWGPT
jgi:hypothetical protein